MAAKKTRRDAAKTKRRPTVKAKRPPAKPVARATPKVSPLRGMPVADWVRAKTRGWQAEVVERLLDLARRAAPQGTVSIKWGQPVLEHGGPVAFIKVAAAHVTFGFWRGAELADPRRLLDGGDVMKHVKITSLEMLDGLDLAAWVREAVALNVAKGDPTRRSR